MLTRSLFLAVAAATLATAQYDTSSSAAATAAATTSPPSSPTSTVTYACNPAHSYPNGYSCLVRGSSLTLVGPTATGGGGGGGNNITTTGGGGNGPTFSPKPPIATGAAAAPLAPALGAILAGMGFVLL